MHITLIPQRRDNRLRLEKQGDTLQLNDEAFDLSAIPEGATLPRKAVQCDWLVSDIERRDGLLHFRLILPHGPDARQQTLFPAPLTALADGDITLPAHSLPEEDAADAEY